VEQKDKEKKMRLSEAWKDFHMKKNWSLQKCLMTRSGEKRTYHLQS